MRPERRSMLGTISRGTVCDVSGWRRDAQSHRRTRDLLRRVLQRLAGECVDVPGSLARMRADGLETTAHVGALASVDQARRLVPES